MDSAGNRRSGVGLVFGEGNKRAFNNVDLHARLRVGPSLKGSQIVAGRRSVVQTTGRQTEMIFHPFKGWQKTVAPLQGAGNARFVPVVCATLRPPATI